MKPDATGLESIALRRAIIVDKDKVRYRVYSTPSEFIAVIAENALMAVKVSGISKPHKIVRDLPTEGIAVEAQRMAAIDPEASRVTLPTERREIETQRMTDLASRKDLQKIKAENFKPMNLADLQNNGTVRARILSPEMLHEIIEQHARAPLPPAESPEPVQVEPPAEAPETPALEQPAPIASAPESPEPSAEEKLLAMASATLPTDPAPSTPAADEALSPEEVEKLLHG
ncbi:MAG: hypothetical protein SFW64_01240 [Alphaproteobacteria bacterium]|nr:hypothetical protein [Alphaproteobacteria bacterium]